MFSSIPPCQTRMERCVALRTRKVSEILGPIKAKITESNQSLSFLLEYKFISSLICKWMLQGERKEPEMKMKNKLYFSFSPFPTHLSLSSQFLCLLPSS